MGARSNLPHDWIDTDDGARCSFCACKATWPIADDPCSLRQFKRRIIRKPQANRKLTLAQVAVIKRRLLDGEKQLHLAREYGVSSGAISDIALKHSYRYVEPAREQLAV